MRDLETALTLTLLSTITRINRTLNMEIIAHPNNVFFALSTKKKNVHIVSESGQNVKQVLASIYYNSSFTTIHKYSN